MQEQTDRVAAKFAVIIIMNLSSVRNTVNLNNIMIRKKMRDLLVVIQTDPTSGYGGNVMQIIHSNGQS